VTENPQIAQITQISESASPMVSALFQSFPNPANDGCYIPFQLSINNDQLSISIYNILGQKVKTIEAGQRKAGSYTQKDRAIYWDMKNNSGQGVANGLYFYQLKAGNFLQTKAMVVK
jgi:hypothetical protein